MRHNKRTGPMQLKNLLLLAVACVLPATAGEYAIFASGTRMHIDRHEVVGSKVRLYNADGFIEFDLSRIQAFEAEEPVPAPVRQPVVPAVSAPAAAPQIQAPLPTPQELADAAADKYGLPRQLVRAVMQAESGFQVQAVSPKGAIGLMQLMPGTAQTLGVDPNDPVQNVDAGARYLRDLLQKYDGHLWHALAAYNAGPGAVDRYNGVPPYTETILYVKKIGDQYTKGSQ